MGKFNFVGVNAIALLYLARSQQYCGAFDVEKRKFDSLCQLGDSFANTGNYVRESNGAAHSAYARLPYGEIFFKKPTGRCSNGLVILDYLASASGIAFINPSKDTGANYRKDSIEVLKTALFFVGEIGINDYTLALPEGKSIQDTRNLVSDDVFAIQHGINNSELQRAIEEVEKDNPNVTILYGDYYNAYISLLTNAKRLGFDVKNLQKACCDIGGKYNFDFNRKYGDRGVPICAQLDTYINWNEIHLTQQAYKEISQLFISDILSKIKCGA